MSNPIEIRKKYVDELKNLLESKKGKVAFHYNCTDGLVSAAIINYVFKEKDLIFLPIDYILLNDNSNLSKKIIRTQWFAIVDLSPFNKDTIELYVDHHISNLNKNFNAKEIHFVAGAASTAFLLHKYVTTKLPEYLEELVKMTEITDTASYKINAPSKLKEDKKEYTWDEKVWLLEDACKTAFTIDEHQELIENLSTKGWDGLWVPQIITRIKELRGIRKKSDEIVKEVQITDLVIIVDYPGHYNTAYITHELLYKGAIVGIYATTYPDYVKLSLRLSKRLTAEEIEYYRVDTLAKKMNGGGHKPASGCQTTSLEEAIEIINEWAKTKKLVVSIIDLRKRD